MRSKRPTTRTILILNARPPFRSDRHQRQQGGFPALVSAISRARGITISALSTSRCRSQAYTRPMAPGPSRSVPSSMARRPTTAALVPRRMVNQIFGPVKNKAAEVGTKWELFDRHLLVTGALFGPRRNAREVGYQTLQRDASWQRSPAGAAYHVQGIDLGATGKITDKWSVFGGLVLMKHQECGPVSCVHTNVGLAARLRRESVLQRAHQIQSRITLKSAGRRRTDQKYTAARCSPRTRARRSRTIGASTPLSKARLTRTGR